VNTDYVLTRPDGMGIWLAVFDNTGDLAGSISKRPDMRALAELLDEKGDEIFRGADSIVVEIDMEKEIIKRIFRLAEKYRKKVFAVVSNMTIALEHRAFFQSIDCFVCNVQEAGVLFVEDFSAMRPQTLAEELGRRIASANIPAMVVTMGGKGAVYASLGGESGFCPARKVAVQDTSGAGDGFCAGVAIGLTYGKTLEEAVGIGTRLAASVITISESTCPRFLPRELGLDMDVPD
jgi:pseudouridine kinase